jgi:hypothetical protein
MKAADESKDFVGVFVFIRPVLGEINSHRGNRYSEPRSYP